jgi:RNA polymerase sigma-70 factor (ECF subfamily)
MSWTEITVLVERAKTGDREAYGELVTRFQSSVYAMALSRVRDPLEAQELAQDVFVHAMRKLPQLRDPRCFAGWLRRITARMAINRLTRRGPLFGTDPEILDAVQGNGRSPEENLEVGEAIANLKEGLAELKPLDRATSDKC